MYQGFRSYNEWNIALWLANDRGLYSLVGEALRLCRTKDEAAEMIYSELCGEKTPDGAPYTRTAIRRAIANWE